MNTETSSSSQAAAPLLWQGTLPPSQSTCDETISQLAQSLWAELQKQGLKAYQMACHRWEEATVQKVLAWEGWNQLANSEFAPRELFIHKDAAQLARLRPAPGWQLLMDHDSHRRQGLLKGLREELDWVRSHQRGEGKALLEGDNQPPACIGKALSYCSLQRLLAQRSPQSQELDGKLVAFWDEFQALYRWGWYHSAVDKEKVRVVIAARKEGGFQAMQVLRSAVFAAASADFCATMQKLKVPKVAIPLSKVSFPQERRILISKIDEVEIAKLSDYHEIVERILKNIHYWKQRAHQRSPVERQAAVYQALTGLKPQAGQSLAQELAGVAAEHWNKTWNLFFAHFGLVIPSGAYGRYPAQRSMGRVLFSQLYSQVWDRGMKDAVESLIYSSRNLDLPVPGADIPYSVLYHLDFFDDQFKEGEWVAYWDERKESYCYGLIRQGMGVDIEVLTQRLILGLACGRAIETAVWMKASALGKISKLKLPSGQVKRVIVKPDK